MKNRTNQELLLAYDQDHSEEAFAELVRRYLDFVYSVAVRLVRDRHLAEDVAQRTFVALAQNAARLVNRPVLSGWLHRTTHNFAVMTIRTEERRRRREQLALTHSQTDAPGSDWDRIAPHLDHLLSELSEPERDALTLRYFEGKNSRDIGQLLGLSEEAAQKRVTRALERLRRLFATKGIAITSSALALAIPANAIQSAPAWLHANLAAHVVGQAATTSSVLSSILHSLNIMAQLKVKSVCTTLAILAWLSLGTTGVIFGRSAAARHWSAHTWQHALAAASSRQPASSVINETQRDVAPQGSPAAQQLSVSEIMAEAAAHFRARNSDPDAWPKGFVALEKLRPEQIEEAIPELERYANERQVFNSMGPVLMGLWAETDPRAALAYSLKRLKGSARALSLEYVSQGWSRRNPAEAWAWFTETNDSGQLPIHQDTWRWLPQVIFGEWALSDPAAALKHYEELALAEQRVARHGIASAASDSTVRSGILGALSQITDESARRRLATEVGSSWARTDPAAAAQWAGTLDFENPAARMQVIGEILEEWWPLDPHAAVRWTLTQAPAEWRDRIFAAFRHAPPAKQ